MISTIDQAFTIKPSDNNKYSSTVFNKFGSDVIPFPRAIKPRWTCSVSKGFRFAKRKADNLQIIPSQKHSQFYLVCKLLKANTCDVIYFDEQFTQTQLATLRVLQTQTQTTLINAKQAFMFNQHISEYA